MEKDLEKEIKKILKLIQEARKYTEPFHPAELFKISAELLAFQAWLIKYILNAETTYRQKIIEFKNETTQKNGKIKETTNTEAEFKAKATIEYTDYRHLKYVYDLIGEQVKLIKKFSDKLKDEEINIQ